MLLAESVAQRGLSAAETIKVPQKFGRVIEINVNGSCSTSRSSGAAAKEFA